MLLGIGSYTFPWACGVPGSDFPQIIFAKDLIDIASANGLMIVQYGDNMPLHLLSANELTKLKTQADESGIQIEVGARGLRKENIICYLEIAKKLQSPFIRFIIDEAGYQPSVDEVITEIKSVLPLLKEAVIKLAIENHDRFKAPSLIKIIEETDPEWAGICLDTCNSIGAGESLYDTVSILAPYTINLHIKDVIIQRLTHKMGFIVEGVAAGLGMIDIPWVLEQLEPFGKCKTAIIELWISPEGSEAATFEKEKTMALKSIQYLKYLQV